MQKLISHIFFGSIGILLTVLVGCSTEKDAALNRGYHNMTSRFNGYYNAGVVVDLAVGGYRSAYTDDYYKILPLEVYPGEEDASGLFPDMDKAIEKCERVILRHSMPSQEKKKGSEELCRWIDDNWLIIAKCHYIKREYMLAAQKFDYVQKTYPTEESVYEAQIWLAKTQIALGNYAEAKRILTQVEISLEAAKADRDRKFLKKLSDIKGKRAAKKKNKQRNIEEPAVFPKRLEVDYYATAADLYIQQGEFKSAIENLELAIDVCDDKRQRARYMFVLAQLYQEMGDGGMASFYYNKVAHSSAPYEMQFQAKINKALSSTGGSVTLRKELYKMLKDDKNAEYKDQIYYALAELDMKEGNIPNAKTNYSSSVYWSVKNNRQKGVSYLRLADLYFAEKDYIKAQRYYDSCVTVLPKDYEGYEALSNKAEGLQDLVFHYETVIFEDSVQAIANLDPESREKFLEQTRKDLIEAEELRKKQEQERLLATQDKVNNQTTAAGDGTKWYFYNTKVRGSGFNDFRAQWGTRPLEDNWRRADKTSFAVDEDNPDADSSATKSIDSLTVEDLLVDIPLTEGAMDSSNARLINSLYMLGVIYKEQLKEEPEAIAYFNQVIDRGIEHPRVLESMYQLYLIYSKKGAPEADRYKQMILDRYPDSEIAELMRDPDYLRKKEEASKKELYEYSEALDNYKFRYYGAVITQCNLVIAYQPKNKYLLKYYLLKAYAVSKTTPGNYDAIASPLQELYDLAPDTEEGKLAKAYLDKMRAGGNLVDPDGPQENSGPYSVDLQAQHFFVVVIPKEGNAEVSKIKLANFNNEFFRQKRYSVINSVLDENNQVLVVKTFANYEEGKSYTNAYYGPNSSNSIGTMAKDFSAFMITAANFATLMSNKDIDVYLDFYQKHYP